MKYLKLIIVLLLIVLLVRLFGADSNAQESLICPEGSTATEGKSENDYTLCKIDPTGCPYGDSIPLGAECDKHAPETIKNEPEAQKTSFEQDNTPIVGK